MGCARIVQQPAKRLQPNGSLPDMLMPVQLRSAGRLGVIAVPHTHVLEAHSRIELLQCLFKPVAGRHVVTRHVRMAGIDASRHRHVFSQPLHQFRDLLEAAAEGIFRTRGIFNRNFQTRFLDPQTIDRFFDCFR